MRLALCGLVATTIITVVSSQHQGGRPVKTTSGILIGAPSRNDLNTFAYLGIPFAEPPVGEKRWTAPIRFKFDGQRNATNYARDCAGTSTINGAKGPDPGAAAAKGPGGLADTPPTGDVPANSFGETGLTPAAMSALSGGGTSAAGATDDCLYLNVWAPPKRTENMAPKAVLVFFYGGAFVAGGTSNGIYDGSLMASSQDVVVVTTNYRLSIFGFPGAPGLPDQNLGILDQRSAVEWVRDNIAAFGGDPKKITLFGHSAGGDSVDIYSYAWTKDPIVNGFISESGASTMCGLVGKQSYDNWKLTAAALKCAGDPAKELECMRSKSTAEVQTAVKNLPSKGFFIPPFVPVVDEKVVFEDYFDRGAKGLFIKAPYIVGNTDKEMGPQFKVADEEFVCPSAQIANSRRNAGVPVWRYRFYGGGPVEAGSTTFVSAGHGAEVQFVFGNVQPGASSGILSAINGPTPQKTAVSKHLQKVWADFAKDPAKGPTSNGWLNFDPAKDSLVRLMYQNESAISFERGDRYDASCVPSICKNAG